MLVLSRKANESIRIGSDIRIVVVGFRNRDGQKVALQDVEVAIGIEAPRHIEIARSELVDLDREV